MSQITLSGNASGTGVFTIASPNSNSNYTQTLPAATGTLYIPGTTVSNIQSGTAVASTSGTSIDFTSIPSWVKRITVMFNGVSLSSTAQVLIQLGVGSTPTTTGYLSGQVYVLIGGGGTNGTSSTSGFVLQAGAAVYTLNGSLTLNLLNSSTNLWTGSGVMYNQTSVPLITSSAGVVALSGTLGMVRITTTGADTFDAGSINILYE